MPPFAPSQNTPKPTERPIQRALVVDDSDLQRRILCAILGRGGVEVREAASGDEALRICEGFHPDLVLSDWVMPGMDGLEFCRRFRQMERNEYGYFILLTAKREKGEIAQGLNAGADDFLSKPINREELSARISAGERILQMQRELSAKNKVISDTLSRLQEVYDAIDKDLKQARHIQQALLPERMTELHGSRISTLLHPCGHVGGDLVGLFSPGSERLGFYNIDVSGHGITSAMVTARIASYLSESNPENNIALQLRFERYYAMRSPDEVATLLNNLLLGDRGVNEYLTMVFATVDLGTGRLKLVQAGHPPPILIKPDAPPTFIGDGGLPVGLIDEAKYTEIDIRLQRGEKLLLYSDGFSECVTRSGEMLGEEGLVEMIQSMPPETGGPEFLDDLYWRLCNLKEKDVELEDDVSAVLLEFQPP